MALPLTLSLPVLYYKSNDISTHTWYSQYCKEHLYPVGAQWRAKHSILHGILTATFRFLPVRFRPAGLSSSYQLQLLFFCAKNLIAFLSSLCFSYGGQILFSSYMKYLRSTHHNTIQRRTAVSIGRCSNECRLAAAQQPCSTTSPAIQKTMPWLDNYMWKSLTVSVQYTITKR